MPPQEFPDPAKIDHEKMLRRMMTKSDPKITRRSLQTKKLPPINPTPRSSPTQP